jgi:peptidoglycan/LPS O-acetylase OafA/YrhL
VAHRDDIQGLRAVAVLLVAFDHAGVPFLAGGYIGVDVFFVLSGFLITGILLAEFVDRGRISLPGFYLRRARRILPAAALTLVVTDIAAHHLLNVVRAREAVGDSIWSALFAANVHFARQGTDYFAQGQPPSPFLHFWSLAVEEQFYLVWPSVLAVLLVLRFRRLLILVVAVGAASLVWSIHVTAASPATAYYSTFARAWELALGASLAVAAPRLRRLPSPAGLALGWGGLLAIGYAAFAYSESTPFPGVAALVPAAGAALLIVAGLAARPTAFDAGRVLAAAPLRYLGDRSYAFYLWHWPVLILAAEYAGRELSLGVKLGLLAFAFALSIASYGIVENPIRQMKPTLRLNGVLWPATATAVALVSVLILDSTDRATARLDAAAAAVHPAELVRRGRSGQNEVARRGGSCSQTGRARRPAAVTGDALAGESPRRLLHAPGRLLAGTGQDVEHDLPPGRPLQYENDRRDRRLARADVDATDSANGRQRRLGGRSLHQAALHSALVELERRVREVVPLGNPARLRAAPAGHLRDRQLDGGLEAAARNRARRGVDSDDEARFREGDRRRRRSRSAARPD